MMNQNMMNQNAMSQKMMNRYNRDTSLEKQFPVAMAYVPWQFLDKIYEDLEDAMFIGTIFPELDRPFMWKGGCCR